MVVYVCVRVLCIVRIYGVYVYVFMFCEVLKVCVVYIERVCVFVDR